MENKRKTISKKTRFEVFKRDNFTCQYCGRMAPDVILEIDHINSVKNGGDNSIINLITSCFECNRGKGKRKLSEHQELKKQQEMLIELNNKREQLEMLVKWKKELSKLDEEMVDKIEELFKVFSLNDNGRNNIMKCIKKYGFDETYESAKISYGQYCDENNEETFNKVINYIPRICYNRLRDNQNPIYSKINYICGILRNRLYYFNEIRIKKYLINNMNENDIQVIIDISKNVRNWTELKETLEEYFGEEL